jgi:hypothetical protein
MKNMMMLATLSMLTLSASAQTGHPNTNGNAPGRSEERAAREAKFEEHKAMVEARIQEHIARAQAHEACVHAAQNREALKACEPPRPEPRPR